MVKKSFDNIINEEYLSISEDVNDTNFNSDDEESVSWLNINRIGIPTHYINKIIVYAFLQIPYNF